MRTAGRSATLTTPPPLAGRGSTTSRRTSTQRKLPVSSCGAAFSPDGPLLSPGRRVMSGSAYRRKFTWRWAGKVGGADVESGANRGGTIQLVYALGRLSAGGNNKFLPQDRQALVRSCTVANCRRPLLTRCNAGQPAQLFHRHCYLGSNSEPDWPEEKILARPRLHGPGAVSHGFVNRCLEKRAQSERR